MSGKPSLSIRQQKKAQTRRALLTASYACFSELGYLGTQVSDITRRAGLAHGTFYVHFADKAAALDELLTRFNQKLVEKLQRAWPEQPLANPWASICTIAEICLDHWSSERHLVAAFAQRAGLDGNIESLRDGINPPVAAFLSGKLHQLASAVKDSLPDAPVIAQALLGMWTRIGLQHVFGDLEKDTAARLLASLSMGALATQLPTLATSFTTGTQKG